MRLDLRSNRDFWAGLMFFAIGAFAMILARDYPLGSSLRMGPGYFPIILGGILIILGFNIMIRGLRRNEVIKGKWSIRAFIILPVVIVFCGFLMDRAGFIPAIALLIFGSALAGRWFKWTEVLLFTVFLTLLSLACFVWGLNLNYPLIKGF